MLSPHKKFFMPHHHDDPLELLVAIAKVLKKLRIPHIVTGGIAVLMWGRPRFTADIDIVVELRESDAKGLEKALRMLGKAGYLDPDIMKEAIKTTGEFNYIDGDSGVKVDFWVLKNDVFDRERLKRKRVKTIQGEKIYFTSPEDLLLIKLKWHKASGSSKQWEDVISIIKISGKNLEWNYLSNMGATLKVGDLLKKAKVEALRAQ